MRPRTVACALLAAASVIAPACSSGSASPADAPVDTRGPAPSLCDRYHSDVATPVYATIQQIFDENCSACHVPGADLPLSPGPAWPLLVGRAAPTAEACGGVLVVPGDPEASYLYQKLSSDAPCFGVRMPRGDFGSVPLPDCVVGVVRRWIAEGAPGPAAVQPPDAGAVTDGAGG